MMNLAKGHLVIICHEMKKVGTDLKILAVVIIGAVGIFAAVSSRLTAVQDYLER